MAYDTSKEIVIDNQFFLPPGVVDMRRAGQDDGSSYYGSSAAGGNAGSSGGATTPGIGGGAGSVIPIPSTFTVVDQQVRITPDGNAVVDVTLEFPDVVGVLSVDVRIAKA